MSFPPYRYSVGEKVFSIRYKELEMTIVKLDCYKVYKKYFLFNTREYLGHLCEWEDSYGNKQTGYFREGDLHSDGRDAYIENINQVFSNGVR